MSTYECIDFDAEKCPHIARIKDELAEEKRKAATANAEIKRLKEKMVAAVTCLCELKIDGHTEGTTTWPEK